MKPRRVGIDRRRWLQLVGTGVAGATFSGCGDNLVVEAATILEPVSDGFLVALWSRFGLSVDVEIRSDGNTIGTTTVELVPNTGTALDVNGLDPDRVYEVVVTGGVSQILRTRTAPADDATRSVRIAVGADFDPSPEFDTDLCDHIVAAAPELLVTIGDFPYTDNGPPALTLDVYRERHVDLRMAPRLRGVFEAMPVRAIYDDHEFRNNWDAGRAAAEPDRYAAAMRAWDEFFPLRAPVGQIRYRSFRWGAHLEGFLLDARRFRSSDSDPDSPAKTMLGQTQHDWLVAALAASTAPFKLVFTSIPLGFGVGDDHWSTFTHARDALFAAIVAAGISGVLFVSGDQHWFASHRHAYGIREIQIGPLARGFGTPPPPEPGVLFRSVRYNAGIIDVDATSLTFAGLDSDGNRFYEETLTKEQLTPSAKLGALGIASSRPWT